MSYLPRFLSLSCLAGSALAFTAPMTPSLRSAARLGVSPAQRTVMSSAAGFDARRKAIGLCTAAAFSVGTGAFVGVESASAADAAETMTISTTGAAPDLTCSNKQRATLIVFSDPGSTLEATQGQNDSFVSQLPYKCYLEEVASVGD